MRFLPDVSCVEVGGRMFPACRAICPQGPDQADTEESRTLGGLYRAGQMQCYVPLENGVLASLDLDRMVDGRLRLTLWLYSRTCALTPAPDLLWLPASLRLVGRDQLVKSHPGGRRRCGVGFWLDCEEWWVAEQLDRLATCEVEQLAGPECTLVPLAKDEERA